MEFPSSSGSAITTTPGRSKELPKYLIQLDKRRRCAFIILLKNQNLEQTQIKNITSCLKKEKIINPDSKCYIAVLEESVTEDIYSGDTQIILKNPDTQDEEAILTIKTLGLTRSNLEQLISPNISGPSKRDFLTRQLPEECEGEATETLEDASGNKDNSVEFLHEDENEPPDKIQKLENVNVNPQFLNTPKNYMDCIQSWSASLRNENLLPTNWTSCLTHQNESESILNIFELESTKAGLTIKRSIQVFPDGMFQICISPFICTDIFKLDRMPIESLASLLELLARTKMYYPCSGLTIKQTPPKTAPVVQRGQNWYSSACQRAVNCDVKICSACRDLENSWDPTKERNVTFESANNTSGNTIYVYNDGKFDVGQTIYANLENVWEELGIVEAAKKFKSLPEKEKR